MLTLLIATVSVGLAEPIKEVGEVEVVVKLYNDVDVTLTVAVVAE